MKRRRKKARASKRARAKKISKRAKVRPLMIINPTRYPRLNVLIMQAVPSLVAAIIQAHTKLGSAEVTRISESRQRPSDDGSHLITELTGESTFYVRRDSTMALLLVEGESCAVH